MLNGLLLSMAVFGATRANEYLLETIWPAKPKVFTIWPFTVKFANPYSIRQDFTYKWINAQSPNETFSIINFYFKDLM